MLDSQTKNLDAKILTFIKDNACSAPSSEQAFEALALQIFAYQFERNQNYRKFCLLEGKNPATVSNWKEIPAMPAEGFKELVLSTFPAKNALKVFKTSLLLY